MTFLAEAPNHDCTPANITLAGEDVARLQLRLCLVMFSVASSVVNVLFLYLYLKSLLT